MRPMQASPIPNYSMPSSFGEFGLSTEWTNNVLKITDFSPESSIMSPMLPQKLGLHFSLPTTLLMLTIVVCMTAALCISPTALCIEYLTFKHLKWHSTNVWMTLSISWIEEALPFVESICFLHYWICEDPGWRGLVKIAKLR